MKCKKCSHSINSETQECPQCGWEINKANEKPNRLSQLFVDSLSAPYFEKTPKKKRSWNYFRLNNFGFGIRSINYSFWLKSLVVFLLLLFGYFGVAYGYPKLKDFREVSSAIKKAKNLEREGSYKQALASISSTAGNWAFDYQNEKINKIKERLKENLESKEKLEKAKAERKEGNFQSSANILSQIKKNSPYYEKAQIRLNEVKQLIKEKKKKEKPKKEQPKSSKFKIGDHAKTTGDLSVRNRPSTEAKLLLVAPSGTKGKIVGGPRQANGSWWWKVDYGSGISGWSIEGYLTKISKTPPKPNNFSIGQKVRTTIDLNVRSEPSIEAPKIVKESKHSRGTVVKGLKYKDSLWWYQIMYSSGYTGWSAAKYLEKAPKIEKQNESGSSDSNKKNSDSQKKNENPPEFKTYVEAANYYHDTLLDFANKLKKDVKELKKKANFSDIDISLLRKNLSEIRKKVKELGSKFDNPGTSRHLLLRATSDLGDVLDFVEDSKNEWKSKNYNEEYADNFLIKAENVILSSKSALERAKKILSSN
ncbi:MAG: SH3 domain-containing protein [Candidatus Magasanikbacteria bacterium]